MLLNVVNRSGVSLEIECDQENMARRRTRARANNIHGDNNNEQGPQYEVEDVLDSRRNGQEVCELQLIETVQYSLNMDVELYHLVFCQLVLFNIH